MRNKVSSRVSNLVLRLVLLEMLAVLFDAAGSAATQSATVRAQAVVSCSAPATPEQQASCAALEQQVLGATVFLRFTMYCGPDGDRSGRALVASHATVVDNRTLLTHDHFARLGDVNCDAHSVEVFAARGGLLAEIEDVIVLDDLVRQLRPNRGGDSRQARTLTFPKALLTPSPGLVFERFNSLPGEAVLAGWGELAQVNWRTYPRQTYVQWVKPTSAEMRGAAYGVVVGKQVEIGASGGGVFRVVAGRLYHVGNVWATWQDDDASLVALNRLEAPQ